MAFTYMLTHQPFSFQHMFCHNDTSEEMKQKTS